VIFLRCFRNEFDRPISVEADDHGPDETPIHLAIKSKGIIDEGFYTRREAEELRDALTRVLA
jgi:hypothetical protein